MTRRTMSLLPFCLIAIASATNGVSGTGPGFRFVSWGDTKGGRSVLASQSSQVLALKPALTIYCGDLVSNFSVSALKAWKAALNGKPDNGLFDRTFAVRGNHDKGPDTTWQGFFNFGKVASAVGATHYGYLTDGLTYSFDYGNSHFVGVDVPGDVTLMTRKEIEWLDQDLNAAEQRGLTHAFLFWHGPLYPLGGHCCSASKPEFVAMANRHPIISAIFQGHEHQIAWVHIDKTRYSNVTHEFEEFVTAASGARTKGCRPGRSDYCRQADGFAVIDVSGNSFTVRFFQKGESTPAWERTFTKREKGGKQMEITIAPDGKIVDSELTVRKH